MKLIVKKGRTSFLAHVFIQDTTKQDGSGLTGLAYNSSGLTAYRARDDDGNAGATAITLATMTRGTWATGGFVEKDATNMPGVYEFGVPDAALASGSDVAVIMLKGATNMAPVVMEIQLVAFDPQDSVRQGMTALPNAAAAASGGLPTFGTGAGQINVDGAGNASANVIKVNGTTQTARDLGNALPSAAPGASGGLLTVGNIRFQKNAAYNNFVFRMTDSSDHVSAKTGLTVTSQVSLDGGAFAATANSVTEIGSGWYKLNLAAADLNANSVALKFTATGADQLDISIYPQVE